MTNFLKSKWILANVDNEKEKILNSLNNTKSLKNLSYSCLEILYNRGFKTEEDILNFLDMQIEDIHNPFELKDCEKAVDILISLKNRKDNPLIVCYTDYDCDGVTSGAISVLALRKLGFNVNFFTNNRFKEGYGINKVGVDNLLNKFPDCKCIYTTDNGIVGFEGIEYAKSKGLIVIVTDHHDPGDKLPIADAIINPKRKDCEYPFKGLCGAGVTFKIMCLLYHKLGYDVEEMYEFLDILALGTVGDLVPLIDENRVFVKEGLRRVKEEKRLAFKILREELDLKDISEYTFGFIYSPMLNASGRLIGNAFLPINLFLEENENNIREIVRELRDLNEKRKKITEEQTELAINSVNENVKEVIVSYNEKYHEGVVGLIAGRIKEDFCRPTIVLSPHFKKTINKNGEEEEIKLFKGSARSIEGFHIKKAFDKLSHFLEGYGGHAMAGGLSILEENIKPFTEALCKLANETLSKEDFIPKVLIDTVIEPKDLTIDIIDELNLLKPFGQNFQSPNFGIKNVQIKNVHFLGQDGKHLKLTTKEDKTILMFGGTEYYNKIGLPKNIKAVGYPSLNNFNNNVNIQFIVKNENMVGVRRK